MSGTPRLHRLPVPADADGQRLDRFLARSEQLLGSRSRIQRLIAEGNVSVEGKAAKASQAVKAGQEVMVLEPSRRTFQALPERLPLDILYEDDDVLVINKPRDLVVHPAPGHESGTLVNALLAYADDLSGLAGMERPGIVHRLDKDTTGAMLVAKNDAAHATLSAELKRRQIERRYLAVAHGVPGSLTGVIDAPIGRHPVDRKRMAVTPEGRSAWTQFWVLQTFGRAYSLLELKLFTGRTHQIRVHLAYIGHPVLCDPLYGPRNEVDWLAGQALHAYRLTFTHPRTRESLTFIAPLPADLRRTLVHLRQRYGVEKTEVRPDRARKGPHSG